MINIIHRKELSSFVYSFLIVIHRAVDFRHVKINFRRVEVCEVPSMKLSRSWKERRFFMHNFDSPMKSRCNVSLFRMRVHLVRQKCRDLISVLKVIDVSP